jgi:hypothetical protein
MGHFERVLVPGPRQSQRQKLHVLRYLGGMGKTQLTIEFARQYHASARCFGTTLSRRHKGSQHARTKEARERQLLNPQQEHELVLYIERCTRRGLPPTREMVQNFASTIMECEVSRSWVTRFLHRHADELTIKWSPRIDRERHKADSPFKYKLYFNLLHSKMQEYGVDVENTYNIFSYSFLFV